MNKKAFIKWQIRELLPVYIISFVVIAVIFWFTIMSSELMPEVYPREDTGEYSVFYYSALPPLYAILIPALLASTLWPISVFSYQTNHIRSDFFYQVPLKEKELRKIRIFLNLTILEVIVTFVYWIGILFIFASQISKNSASDYFSQNPFYYNYGYFVLYYFVLIIGIALNFFISSYFISLGTRTNDSNMYLVFGQLFLAFVIVSILLPIQLMLPKTQRTGLADFITTFMSFSWLETIMETNVFRELTTKGTYEASTIDIVARIAGAVGYLGIGTGCLFAMLKKKDPSGEYAGKATPVNTYISLYPHIFAVMTGLLIASAIGSFGILMLTNWMLYILWAAAYYFTIVAVNGGFHFKIKNWMYFGGISLFTLIVSILLYVI